MTSPAQADGGRVVVLVEGNRRPQPFAQHWPSYRLPITVGDAASYAVSYGLGYVQPRRL